MLQMNKCLPLLLVLIIFVRCASTHSTSKPSSELEGKDFLPVGRFKVTNTNELELIGTAVHFGIKFSGNACTVITSVPGHGYIQYVLDGAYQKRIRLNTGLDSIVIRSENTGTHKVW